MRGRREYEQIAKLQPADLETHLILGQLYGFNQDSLKAEAHSSNAREIDSNSEEAVLSIARLYTEQGEPQQVVDILNGIPDTNRSARVDFILGTSYDKLDKPKEAAKA